MNKFILSSIIIIILVEFGFNGCRNAGMHDELGVKLLLRSESLGLWAKQLLTLMQLHRG